MHLCLQQGALIELFGYGMLIHPTGSLLAYLENTPYLSAALPGVGEGKGDDIWLAAGWVAVWWDGIQRLELQCYLQ